MKRTILCLVLTCLSLSFFPDELKAKPDSLKPITDSSEAKILIQRLQTINAMDKSNLSWKEKREIRKEVRSIDQRLRILGGGIYISVGLLLIIVVLLILLL